VLLVLSLLGQSVLSGCANRVEVDEPGDWDSIYIGAITIVDHGVEYTVRIYKTRIDEEALRVYTAVVDGRQGVGIAVVPQ